MHCTWGLNTFTIWFKICCKCWSKVIVVCVPFNFPSLINYISAHNSPQCRIVNLKGYQKSIPQHNYQTPEELCQVLLRLFRRRKKKPYKIFSFIEKESRKEENKLVCIYTQGKTARETLKRKYYSLILKSNSNGNWTAQSLALKTVQTVWK